MTKTTLSPFSQLQRLCTSSEMQAMDHRTIHNIGIPGIVLMENAAHSVADKVETLYLSQAPHSKILVCCGKGNNGGDGFAIARLLKNRGYHVSTMDTGMAKTEDALANQTLWGHFGQLLTWSGSQDTRHLEQADIIIDAIFGTGLERDISGSYREWIEAINQTEAIRIAIDIPSGVHADHGQIMGVAIQCDQTITFQVAKQGCFQYPGVAYCGEVIAVPISIEPYWEDTALPTYHVTPNFVRTCLPQRNPTAHKGSFGHLLTITGSAGMAGAALLSSYAAIKNGCGLVSACVPLVLRDSFLGQCPEVMTLSPSADASTHFTESHLPFVENEIQKRDAVVLGCGLGNNPQTAVFVETLLTTTEKPLLIDADGLNHISGEHLKQRSTPTIITPHPRELSRLCGLSTEAIQQDRITTARKLAQEWNVVLLLKGANTVIASPDGQVFINSTGNEGMATAGSGDVLSGMIGSFLAQNHSPLEATLLGAYLHGLSGDCLKEALATSYMSALNLIHGLNEARLSLENN